MLWMSQTLACIWKFFPSGSPWHCILCVECSWADAAKFLTGFSSVGSIAIPAILRHANLITAGAMWIEFAAFFILLSTVMIFQKVSQEDDYYWCPSKPLCVIFWRACCAWIRRQKLKCALRLVIPHMKSGVWAGSVSLRPFDLSLAWTPGKTNKHPVKYAWSWREKELDFFTSTLGAGDEKSSKCIMLVVKALCLKSEVKQFTRIGFFLKLWVGGFIMSLDVWGLRTSFNQMLAAVELFNFRSVGVILLEMFDQFFVLCEGESITLWTTFWTREPLRAWP